MALQNETNSGLLATKEFILRNHMTNPTSAHKPNFNRYDEQKEPDHYYNPSQYHPQIPSIRHSRTMNSIDSNYKNSRSRSAYDAYIQGLNNNMEIDYETSRDNLAHNNK